MKYLLVCCLFMVVGSHYWNVVMQSDSCWGKPKWYQAELNRWPIINGCVCHDVCIYGYLQETIPEPPTNLSLVTYFENTNCQNVWLILGFSQTCVPLMGSMSIQATCQADNLLVVEYKTPNCSGNKYPVWYEYGCNPMSPNRSYTTTC